MRMRRIFVRPSWREKFVEVDTEYMLALWPDVDIDVDETTELHRDGHDIHIEIKEIDAERSDR